MELSSLTPADAQTIDVVALARRIESLPRVRRERDDEEPAIAPRRDTASFSKEALARLADECNQGV
jgi:hypothetical protein